MMPSPGALLHQINRHWRGGHHHSTIFEDDFKSGDFSAWTGTIGEPTVTSVRSHHGIYSAEIDAAEYCYKVFTPQSTAYARVYVYFISLPTTGRMFIVELAYAATVDYGVTLEIYYDTAEGVVKWRMWYYSTAWYSVASVTPSISTGVWYSVEIQWIRNTAGGAKFWINGDLKGTGPLTTYDGDVDRILAGARVNSAVTSENIDCVVVADTYIGPEVPPPVAGAKAMSGGLYLVFPT